MILVTGGTGYIGSHTVVELMLAGFEVLIVDNFCNSKATVLERIERIVGRRPGFVEADIRDRESMRTLFADYRFDAVIHFAGLKAVGESIAQPLRYYDNNVRGSLVLLRRWPRLVLKHWFFLLPLLFMAILTRCRFERTFPFQRRIHMDDRS